jgi:hypothetical protein
MVQALDGRADDAAIRAAVHPAWPSATSGFVVVPASYLVIPAIGAS